MVIVKVTKSVIIAVDKNGNSQKYHTGNNVKHSSYKKLQFRYSKCGNIVLDKFVITETNCVCQSVLYM